MPDAILYPTGGGVGIIGMWKVFDELEELGWIGSRGRGSSPSRSRAAYPSSKAFHEGLDEVPRARSYVPRGSPPASWW